MWVSRFSIPLRSRAEDVALDGHSALQGPDERGGAGADGDELGHRLAALGDHDSFAAHAIEDGQAALLELGRPDLLHGHTLRLVISDVHSALSGEKKRALRPPGRLS